MNGILINTSGYLTEHRNKVFWFFFTILGIFVIGGFLSNLYFIDILLGLVMIVIGVQRLEEEHNKREMRKEHNKVNDTLKYITQWLDASHDYISEMKNNHELRMFNLNRKKQTLTAGWR